MEQKEGWRMITWTRIRTKVIVVALYFLELPTRKWSSTCTSHTMIFTTSSATSLPRLQQNLTQTWWLQSVRAPIFLISTNHLSLLRRRVSILEYIFCDFSDRYVLFTVVFFRPVLWWVPVHYYHWWPSNWAKSNPNPAHVPSPVDSQQDTSDSGNRVITIRVYPRDNCRANRQGSCPYPVAVSFIVPYWLVFSETFLLVGPVLGKFSLESVSWLSFVPYFTPVLQHHDRWL